MLKKIEHKSNRYSFTVKIQTDDVVLDVDISEYNKGNYFVPEETVNDLLDMTVDAIAFNSNDNKKFVTKVFEYFNKDQMNEALLYLCENLGVKIVEE